MLNFVLFFLVNSGFRVFCTSIFVSVTLNKSKVLLVKIVSCHVMTTPLVILSDLNSHLISVSMCDTRVRRAL